jgi:hypothetical protein
VSSTKHMKQPWILLTAILCLVAALSTYMTKEPLSPWNVWLMLGAIWMHIWLLHPSPKKD